MQEMAAAKLIIATIQATRVDPSRRQTTSKERRNRDERRSSAVCLFTASFAITGAASWRCHRSFVFALCEHTRPIKSRFDVFDGCATQATAGCQNRTTDPWPDGTGCRVVTIVVGHVVVVNRGDLLRATPNENAHGRLPAVCAHSQEGTSNVVRLLACCHPGLLSHLWRCKEWLAFASRCSILEWVCTASAIHTSWNTLPLRQEGLSSARHGLHDGKISTAAPVVWLPRRAARRHRTIDGARWQDFRQHRNGSRSCRFSPL